MLPTASGSCPSMANLNGTNVTFGGQAYTVWSGDPSKGPGPLLVYWYATGSNSSEPTWAIQQPQIAKITAAGGAVIAQVTSTHSGANTGDAVWYTGDVTIADQAVACAIQTQHIDKRRIWVAGYSAGALQTVYMWYARSGYVSGGISYSGGDIRATSPWASHRTARRGRTSSASTSTRGATPGRCRTRRPSSSTATTGATIFRPVRAP